METKADGNKAVDDAPAFAWRTKASALEDTFNVSGQRCDTTLCDLLVTLNDLGILKCPISKKVLQELEEIVSLVLFASPGHLISLSGASWAILDSFIRAVAQAACQPDADSLRTLLGKSQLDLLKRRKISGRSLQCCVFATFMKVLQWAPFPEVLFSNVAVKTAFVESLSLLDTQGYRRLRGVAKATTLCLRSPGAQSALQEGLDRSVKRSAEASSASKSPPPKVSSSLLTCVSRTVRQLRAVPEAELSEVDLIRLGEGLCALRQFFTFCLEQKSPPFTASEGGLDAWAACLSYKEVFEAAEFNVQALMSRALRRWPDGSLPILVWFFNTIQFSLDPLASNLISSTGLLDLLQSDKPETLSLARQLLEAVVRRVESHQAHSRLVDLFASPLTERMVKANEKVRWLEALETVLLTSSLPAAVLCQSLETWLGRKSDAFFPTAKGMSRQELNEDARSAALRIGGRILQITGWDGPQVPHILEALCVALTDAKTSDKLRLAATHGFCLALLNGSCSDSSPTSAVVERHRKLIDASLAALAQTATLAATKPGCRFQSLSALVALWRMSQIFDMPIPDEAAAAKLKQILTREDSFLNDLALIGKASVAELAVQLELMTSVFANPTRRFAQVQLLPLEESLPFIQCDNCEAPADGSGLHLCISDISIKDKSWAPFYVRGTVALLMMCITRKLPRKFLTWDNRSTTATEVWVLPSSNDTNLQCYLQRRLKDAMTPPARRASIFRGIVAQLYQLIKTVWGPSESSFAKQQDRELHLEGCRGVQLPYFGRGRLPSPHVGRQTLRVLLQVWGDMPEVTETVDATFDVLALLACHPYSVGAVLNGRIHHYLAFCVRGLKIPLLPNPLRLYSWAKDNFFFRDSSDVWATAFSELLVLLNPQLCFSIEQKLYQTHCKLPYGYSHNAIVEATQLLLQTIQEKLPVKALVTDLRPYHARMALAPADRLFEDDESPSNVELMELAPSHVAGAKTTVAFSSAQRGGAAPRTLSKTGKHPGGHTKQPSAAPDGGDKIRAKDELKTMLLVEQQSMRRTILTQVDRVVYLYRCLKALARSNTAVFEKQLPCILPVVFEFLKTPLTCHETLLFLDEITKALVDHSALPHAHSIPRALFFSALNRPAALGSPFLALLTDVSNTAPLSQATIALLSPYLRFALIGTDQARLCAAGLTFFVRQLEAGSRWIELQLALEGALHALRLPQTVENEGATNYASLIGLATQVLRSVADTQAGASCPTFIPTLVLAGQHDDSVVRHAALVALKTSGCAVDVAFPLLAVCAEDQEAEDVRRLAQALLDGCQWRTTADEFAAQAKAILNLMSNCSSQSCVAMAARAYARVARKAEANSVSLSNAALEDLFFLFRNSNTPEKKAGACLALSSLAQAGLLASEERLQALFLFLLGEGLKDARLVISPSSASTSCAWTSLLQLLENLGSDAICNADPALRPHLYKTLEEIQKRVITQRGAYTPAERTVVDGAMALFSGQVAQYADPSDPAVKAILDRLLPRIIDASCPTREVQRKAADVIALLVRSCATSKQLDLPSSKDLINRLLQGALTDAAFVARNGYALALAAAVKGLGLGSLRDNAVVPTLIDAAQDKQTPIRRQGALLCFQSFSEVLGRLFEPYVAQILPTLMTAFGDAEPPVRNAAQAASKAIMASLSAHGIKLILPNLMERVIDKQWRTRLGSIEALGSMSHCAPKQLAALLPQIVPQLCEVIGDSNPKVKTAAVDALRTIASVITNQEIRGISPVLLAALISPEDATAKAALDALLQAQFVHRIDSASLALICPIVVRALRERSAETKRKAAAIVGSMVFLCENPLDFNPYFPRVCPQLLETLVDPIPDVRAVAARAFGSISRGLSEERLAELLSNLFERLKATDSSVERSGAANGLSEVLATLGETKLEKLLPDLLQNARQARSNVREGYLGLFVYLPKAFGTRFQKFIPDVLPVLLDALSSETESLREVAFRAAEVLVAQYGATHTVLLLNPLEDGIFSADWRIRYSSVALLGTLVDRLLRHVCQPGQEAQSDANAALANEVLSVERRAFILSSIYMVRSDPNPAVREQATQAWKSVVQNTPKTVKEILSILIKRLIGNLTASAGVKQEVASLCIGEIAERLPDLVVPQLVPSAIQLLSSSTAAGRYGGCIGLSHLVSHAPPTALTPYCSRIVAGIRTTVSDTNAAVRSAANECLRNLLTALGPDILSDLLQTMLTAVTSPPTFDPADLDKNPRASQLTGITVLLQTQHQAVLQVLIPLCSRPPFDLSKVRLIGTLASLQHPGPVNYCLPRLLPTVVTVLAEAEKLQAKSIDNHEPPLFDSHAVTEEVTAVAERIFTRCIAIFDTTANTALETICSALTAAAPVADFSAAGLIKLRLPLDDPEAMEVTEPALLEKTLTNPFHRAASMQLLSIFSKALSTAATKLEDANDFSLLTLLFGKIVPCVLCDPSALVRERALQALTACVNVFKQLERSPGVPAAVVTEVRKALQHLALHPVSHREEKELIFIGAGLPGTLQAFYTVFHAALTGDGHTREAGATAFGEFLTHCPTPSLRPIAVKVTGPLVRTLAERTPPSVKSAILLTLRVLLLKASDYLRPLIPQLQISFVKCISDPSMAVRRAAAQCLSVLARLPAARLDFLILELCGSAASQQVRILALPSVTSLGQRMDPTVAMLALQALLDVLVYATGACAATTMTKAIELTKTLAYATHHSNDDFTSSYQRESHALPQLNHPLNTAAAGCLAALILYHSEDPAPLFQAHIIRRLQSQTALDQQMGAMLLAEACGLPTVEKPLSGATETTPRIPLILGSRLHPDFQLAMEHVLTNDQAAVRCCGVVAFSRLTSTYAKRYKEARTMLFMLLPKMSAATEDVMATALARGTGTTAVIGALCALKTLAKNAEIHETSLPSSSGERMPFEYRVLITRPALRALRIPHPAIKLLAEKVLFYAMDAFLNKEAEVLEVFQMNPDLLTRLAPPPRFQQLKYNGAAAADAEYDEEEADDENQNETQRLLEVLTLYTRRVLSKMAKTASSSESEKGAE